MPAIGYRDDCEGVDWARLKRDLAADGFDNGRTPAELERAFRASARAVFARDGERVVGKGRALSDGVCNAYVVDMWTHSAWRRRGIGRWLLERLVAPLRGQHVYLFTDEREDFYAACGFRPRGTGLERLDGHWLGRFPPR
ncbi:MAG: GNAT family N-acetyltransferase [Burkholderiales bacterium]|nr:GNAT family N-acetyltransferase [Burkholderiales bacterium]